MKKIQVFLIVFCEMCLFMLQAANAQGLSEEPKSLRERRILEKKIAQTYDAPREFFIFRDDADTLCLIQKSNLLQYEIRKFFASAHFAQIAPYSIFNVETYGRVYVIPCRSYAKCLTEGYERPIWNFMYNPFPGPAAENLQHPMVKPESPCWDNHPTPFACSWSDPIGTYSYEYRLHNMEKHATYCVGFYRGNVKIYVSNFSPVYAKAVNGSYVIEEEHRSLAQSYDFEKLCELMETPLTPDPREIAWRIDQYLKGDPLKKFSDAEKAKLKTLEVTLPKESVYVQGKEYALDFPRKLPDGTVPAEIRLVVSRGEVQQVSKNPSLAPTYDGQYTVHFAQPGRQTIHCYHLDASGNCLAWGKTDVQVKTP